MNRLREWIYKRAELYYSSRCIFCHKKMQTRFHLLSSEYKYAHNGCGPFPTDEDDLDTFA